MEKKKTNRYDLWVAVVGNISENTGVKSAKKKLDQEPLFLNQETLFALLLGIDWALQKYT